MATFTDDFNRSNRDLNGDNGWATIKRSTAVGGTPSAAILNNQAHVTGATAAIVRDVAVGTLDISATIVSLSDQPILLLRYVGSDFYVSWRSGVLRYVNGDDFDGGIELPAGVAWSAGSTVRCAIVDNVFTFWVDGVLQAQTWTIAVASGSTKAGIGTASVSQSAVAVFDALNITDSTSVAPPLLSVVRPRRVSFDF